MTLRMMERPTMLRARVPTWCQQIFVDYELQDEPRARPGAIDGTLNQKDIREVLTVSILGITSDERAQRAAAPQAIREYRSAS
jgi:hypothetical protein